MTLIHIILIAGHALAGLVALIVGCCVLCPPTPSRWPLFRTYFHSLLTLVGLLMIVVALDWAGLPLVERVVFTGLVGLGIYTAWRADNARRLLIRREAGWNARYVDQVGFTLISLFDAFAIVSAIDLGASPVVVGGVAVLGVAAGIVAINQTKRRLNGRPTTVADHPGSR